MRNSPHCGIDPADLKLAVSNSIGTPSDAILGGSVGPSQPAGPLEVLTWRTLCHAPISGFWYVVLPAALLGLGYLISYSDGFLAAEVRMAASPLFQFIGNVVRAFV